MRVLIVDDEINIRTSLSQFFSVYDIDSELAENGLVAQRLLFSDSFDAMVVDLKMPGMDGLTLIKWMREEGFEIPVIMVSAHGEISDAVSALKGGAADYIVKPFNPEELVSKIQKMVEANKVKILIENDNFENSSFIGQSAQMVDIKKTIARCAKTRSNVLITGESGTGKGVVAKEIHRQSFGEDGPFQSINIGGVPASLIESELFGHEKGAFTGAVSSKKGRFELANGGTIFLDEIGEINLATQIKILRVLQERQFERVGGEKTITVDVRIVTATNKDLLKEIEKGNFREDLYYRLNVVHVEVPPLRERKEDIPLLMASFLDQINKENNTEVKGFTSDAKAALYKYDWPGNIRELRNCIEASIVMCRNEFVDVKDLPPQITQDHESQSLNIEVGLSLAEVEKKVILSTLNSLNGNKSKTAEVLKIGRKTLHRKLEEYK